MKGFICDMCESWFEGEPASGGYHRYIHSKNKPLKYITVSLSVHKEGSSNDMDLCENCVIKTLEIFIESHKDNYPIGAKDVQQEKIH